MSALIDRLRHWGDLGEKFKERMAGEQGMMRAAMPKEA
jgi:hypothetical protein